MSESSISRYTFKEGDKVAPYIPMLELPAWQPFHSTNSILEEKVITVLFNMLY